MRLLMIHLALSVQSAAAGPMTIQHSGRLLDNLGEPVEGTIPVRLSLFTQPSGGTHEWTELDTVTLANGYYATALGDDTPLTGLDFAGTAYWLGVFINNVELGERTPIGAVPVALTLSGGLVAPSVTSTALATTDTTDGRIVFNSTLGRLQVYDGGRWVDVGSADHAPINEEKLVAWGRNDAGSFGVGDSSERRFPTASTDLPSGLDIVQVSAGGYRYNVNGAICLVTSEGDMYCAGQGTNVPDGNSTDSVGYTLIQGPQSWREVSIGAGLASCAVTTDDQGYCWGRQQYGAIGNGESGTGNVYTPSLVIGGISWKRLSPGGRYNDAHRAIVCGVTTTTGAPNGYCWGRDDYGMLGHGPGTTHVYDPSDGLIDDFEWTWIEPGGYHVCGITTDQAGYCWGENAYSQLGSSGTTDQHAPVEITGGYSWATLDLGDQHSCGVRTDGVAMCWGRNHYGQVGDGTTSTRTEPVEVVGGKRWLHVTAGELHTCGLDTDHRAWCWGYNGNGEIGDGTNSNRAAPVEVYGEYEFDLLDAGMRESVGITR